MIYKNVSSQKVSVFAYTVATGAAKTGDAANITAYLSKDWAAGAAITDTNPTEMDATNMPGWYAFDLTQAETNAEVLVIAPKSATSGVVVDQVQIFTQDATISSRASQTSVDDVPTVSEFNARTLVAASYFDPSTDTVANVTAVGSVTGAVGSVTGNVGGNVTGSVGSVAAGGITAASIATNAIDADALAADAVTELQTGLATATNLATLAGYVDTEVAAILAAVDTEVAAIKAKTDNLPASPAAVGSAMTLSNGAITAAVIATGAIDADALAADAGTELGTAVWATAARTLTASSDPTAAAIADAVWDEAVAGHVAAGSTGEALGAAGSAGDPWVTALPGAYGAGSAGKILGDNLNATVSSRASQTSVDDIPTNAELAAAIAAGDDPTLAAIAALNNLSSAQAQTAATAALNAYDPPTKAELDSAVAPLATQVSVNDIPTNAELAAALASADDAVLAAIAALNNLSQAGAQAGAAAALTAYGAATAGDVSGLNDISTADILAMAYEGAETLQAYLRLSRAALVGKATGGGTANIAFRDAADTKNRIAATVDGDGNRSAIVTDAS